eukprot:1549163-Pyramimonas_sp.AAC.1
MLGPDDTGPGDDKNETYAVIGGGRSAQSEGTGEGTALPPPVGGAASSSPQVTEQLKQLIQQA